VFDAADNFVPARFPFLIGFAVAILGACVIGAILLRQESQRRALTGDRPRVRVIGLLVALLVVVMASAIVVALTALSSPSQEETARAIESSPVVEGLIEHFHPMPSGGHDTERFDVAGVHFEYSHWNMSQGFNQDVTAGGPIREGLYVRIHYVSIDRPSFATGLSYGTIVRLEIRRESHTFESDEVERSGLAISLRTNRYRLRAKTRGREAAKRKQ